MSGRGKLKWLLRRFLAMSPGEILYRFQHKALQMGYEKRYAAPLGLLALPAPAFSEETLSSIVPLISSAMDFDSLACPHEPWMLRCFDETIDLRRRVRWHACGEAEWETSVFSWRISFRGRDEIGDVRKTFELNRMQFLPRLLLYAKKADDSEIHALARALFYDWIQENPFLRGVNWASPMEAALRAWQWTVCAALTPSHTFRADLLKAALLCVSYVEKNFSAYSSANNHLIVEAACCSMIGALLGGSGQTRSTKSSKNILARELSRQLYADGTNREHALHYHAFVVDMWLQANLIFRALGEKGLHEELLKKALNHIQAMHLGEDYFVEYGDSDDAVILDFTGDLNCYYTNILAQGQKYFKNDKAFNSKKNINEPNFFDEAGYFIYRDHKLYVLFDVAALGFGRLAAHGHADCLQIVAGFDGKPIFIDSGTYIYNVKKESRDYFRSTSAHNTLTYNSNSQSVMQGPFLWSRKAAVIEKKYWENQGEIHVLGAHNGYSPHLHRRELLVDPVKKALIIKDTFPQAFTLHFILHPHRTVRQLHEHLYEIDNGLAFFFSSGEITLKKTQVSFSFLSFVETLVFCVKSQESAVSILSQDKITISELIF